LEPIASAAGFSSWSGGRKESCVQVWPESLLRYSAGWLVSVAKTVPLFEGSATIRLKPVPVIPLVNGCQEAPPSVLRKKPADVDTYTVLADAASTDTVEGLPERPAPAVADQVTPPSELRNIPTGAAA